MTFKEEFDKSPMKVKITLPEETKNKLRLFVEEVISKKESEEHHKVDNSQETKRWYTGFGGECALEIYLGSEYVDLSVGDSKSYHVSDLSKLNLDIGVKTVEFGKFPVIFKTSRSPQIIIVKHGDDFYICGLATIEALTKYQSDDLILSPLLRKRNTKTGFYGFESLEPFKDVADLKLLTKHYPDNTKMLIDGKDYTLRYLNGKYELISDERSYRNLGLGELNKKLKKLVEENRIIIN